MGALENIKDRIKKDKGIRFGTYREVFIIFFESGNNPGCRGNVTACRSPTCCNTFRIDSQPVCVATYPSYSRFRVFYAFERHGAMFFFNTVIRTHRNHST